MSRRRVVITGLGVVTSLGQSVEDLWTALVAGRSGVDTVKRFDVSDFDVRFGSECVDFDPSRYVDRKAAKCYRALGDVHARTRNVDEAIYNYRRYLALTPHARDSRYILSYIEKATRRRR